MRTSLAAKLLDAADELDRLGLHAEADKLTNMVKEAQIAKMPGQAAPRVFEPNPAVARVPAPAQQPPQQQQPPVQAPQVNTNTQFDWRNLRLPSVNDVVRQYTQPNAWRPDVKMPVTMPVGNPLSPPGAMIQPAGTAAPTGGAMPNYNGMMQKILDSNMGYAAVSFNPSTGQSQSYAPTYRDMFNRGVQQYQQQQQQYQKTQQRQQPGYWTADKALQAQYAYDAMHRLQEQYEALRQQYWQLTGQ